MPFLATDQTTFTVNFVTGQAVELTFNTLPGNAPNSNSNFVAIWQNKNAIPYNQDPMKDGTFTPPNDTQSGQAGFPVDLTKSTYIVGYAVGPTLTASGVQTYGNVVATAYFAANSVGAPQNVLLYSSSLTGVFVGGNSVMLQYALPAGCTPAANGAWAGLFQSANGFYALPPTASQAVTGAETGTIVFNNLNLQLGTVYGVGLFASGWSTTEAPTQTPLAATITFTV